MSTVRGARAKRQKTTHLVNNGGPWTTKKNRNLCFSDKKLIRNQTFWAVECPGG